MATYIQEKMPRIQPNDTEGNVRKLYKYMESLNEQLSYIFGNLGGDNFNTQDMGNFISNLGATNIITQTIVSSSVVTKSLYAERGDIAQLTVDWLSTSKKVMKYLNKDTSDDDYIEVHEQGIELKSAAVVMSGTDPLTEMLFDRSGNQLYWQKDISYAEIVDGFPYVNGKQIYMDTEVTEYPVRVYQYNVTTKMLINFGAVDGVNVPKITMGDVVITDSDVFVGDTSFTELDGETVAARIQAGLARNETAALQTDVGALQTDVGALQTDVGALQTAIENLTARVAALETPSTTTE